MAAFPAPPTASASPAAEAWALVEQLVHDARGRMFAVARDLELSPPQIWALRHLEPGAPTAMGELASLLRCDSSNVTGIVDRLEARGLVERRPASHDRRVKHLVLTEDGVDLRTRLRCALAEGPNPFDVLDADDAATLRDILRKAAGFA